MVALLGVVKEAGKFEVLLPRMVRMGGTETLHRLPSVSCLNTGEIRRQLSRSNSGYDAKMPSEGNARSCLGIADAGND